MRWGQDFSHRSSQPELMDTETVTYEEFDTCLRHLAFINRCTLAYRPTLQWLKRQLANSSKPVTILDIGCGGGDMLRRIWNKFQGNPITLIGVDMNPWSQKSAQSQTTVGAPITYNTCNVFSFEEDKRVDYIISSLFAHHLNDAELVNFMRWSDRHATLGWFINDLHRHPLPWLVIRYAVCRRPFHRFIRHDAPVSVARAFTRADWQRLLRQAGIPPERTAIRWHFPFRYGVERWL